VSSLDTKRGEQYAKKKAPHHGCRLGGTKIEAAIVRDGHILAFQKTNTKADQGVDSVIDRIEKTVRAAMKKADRTMAEGARVVSRAYRADCSSTLSATARC